MFPRPDLVDRCATAIESQASGEELLITNVQSNVAAIEGDVRHETARTLFAVYTDLLIVGRSAHGDRDSL